MKQKNLRRPRARLINCTWGARFRSPLPPNHQKHNAKSENETSVIESQTSNSKLDPSDLRWRLLDKKRESRVNEIEKVSRQKQVEDLHRRIDHTKRELEANRVLLTQCQVSLSSKGRKTWTKTAYDTSSTTNTKNSIKSSETEVCPDSRPKSFVIDQDSGVMVFSK